MDIRAWWEIGPAGQPRPPPSQARLATPVRDGLISVIIPTFNRRRLLLEALESLKQQAWRPLQIIVVDDGSTDGTSEALEAWARRTALEHRIIRQDNAGPASARNRGLAAAAGAFIYFIDSDDLVLPQGLFRLAAALHGSDAPYALGLVRNVDRNRRPMASLIGAIPFFDPRGILGSVWSTHAALYRRETIERAGLFDESLSRGEDTELNWRMMAVCGEGALVEETVALRRIHREGRLSDDLSPGSMGRCSCQMIARYMHWAAARGELRPEVATRALQILTIALIRLRAVGDRQAIREAIWLADALLQAGARSNLLFAFAIRMECSFLLRRLLTLVHAARDVRNFVRSAIGRVKVTLQALPVWSARAPRPGARTGCDRRASPIGQ